MSETVIEWGDRRSTTKDRTQRTQGSFLPQVTLTYSPDPTGKHTEEGHSVFVNLPY